ncbi:hypothetical protein ACFYYR_29335 [Streptomyces sp. NPDC001922]|uniref:hypothetical protein n=1 Tax=Streptomyces sp. NPDC001922 TaxID=3364624 RepID=UPI0036887FCF
MDNELLTATTLDLLKDLQKWRIRAVERVDLSSALWSERDREVHVETLSRLTCMQRIMETIDPKNKDATVELTIPLTDLPAVPIIDLDVRVAGEEAYRIPIEESAQLQAKYIARLARDVDHDIEDLNDFLAAIFYFPHDAYRQIWQSYNHLRPQSWTNWMRLKYGEGDPVRDYLESNVGLSFKFSDADYREWLEISQTIGSIAGEYAFHDHLSGPAHPLITLPHLEREMSKSHHTARGEALNKEKVSELLIRLCDFLTEVHKRTNMACENPDLHHRNAHNKLLTTYSGYGGRWMAFARCHVPVNKPFIIHTKARVPVYFTKTRDRSCITHHIRKRAWQTFAFADAKANHLSISVSDTATRLDTRCTALDERGNPTPIADDEQTTFELYLRYDSNETRSQRILVGTPLRITRISSVFLWLTVLITALGLSVLCWRVVNGKLSTEDTAVILLPVTFAAAFLLARDTSTLSMRIRRIRQAILIVELFTLISLVFVLYFAHMIS